MLNWPPIKAWTSVNLIKDSRYFVAINYGKYKERFWVNMVSVLDGNISFSIDFEELNNSKNWIPGWIEFENENIKNVRNIESLKAVDGFLGNACLHPSDDSGFSLDSKVDINRPWFPC